MKSSVKVFFKSFSVSFLVLAVISALLMVFLVNSQPDSTDSQNEPQVIYAASKDEDLTVLLVVCEKRGGDAENFALVKISPNGNYISVAQMPSESMKFSTGNYGGTLKEIYDYGSTNYVITAISREFSISVNRYIKTDHSSLAALVDYLGGMSYTPLQQVDYTYDEDNVMTIMPVTQMIDGRRFAALSQCEDFGNLLSVLISQRFTESLSAQGFFNTIVNETDTNCTSLDYKYRELGWEQMLSDSDFELRLAALDEGSNEWSKQIKAYFS